MITADDVIHMSDLSPEEIAAVAEHEHLGDFDAALISNYLMHTHKGPQAVQKMICDDIREALHADDLAHAKALYGTLRHFLKDHPEAQRGV